MDRSCTAGELGQSKKSHHIMVPSGDFKIFKIYFDSLSVIADLRENAKKKNEVVAIFNRISACLSSFFQPLLILARLRRLVALIDERNLSIWFLQCGQLPPLL